MQIERGDSQPMKRHQRFCGICHKRVVYGKDICCAHCVLEKHLGELGVEFERECRFCPNRRWRADYRLKAVLVLGTPILLEIDGAVYAQGRHNRGKGFEGDMRKINQAQALGYMVLRFSTNMVQRGEARAFLKEHLLTGASHAQ